MKTKTLIGVALVLAVLAIGLAFWGLISRDDGIEKGKVYEIGFTQLANISGVEGRKFDFKDRSLEPNSKIIPLRDGRGVLIVIEDSRMAPGTLKKIRKSAPARTIEGEKYSAQSWVEYHFNFIEKSRQDFIPSFR